MIAERAKTKTDQRLVDALADRLRGPLSLDEPFVLQSRVPQTSSRHAVVIWNAWRSLSPRARSAVILDAYDESGVLDGDVVRVAMGLTHDEAYRLGYLPFQVVALPGVGRAQAKKALNAVGGARIRVGPAVQVRFPSEGQAVEALRHLLDDLPGSHWVIRQEVASEPIL